MTIASLPAPKRAYSSPELVAYGTMEMLTRNGNGSQLENKTSASKNKRS